MAKSLLEPTIAHISLLKPSEKPKDEVVALILQFAQIAINNRARTTALKVLAKVASVYPPAYRQLVLLKVQGKRPDYSFVKELRKSLLEKGFHEEAKFCAAVLGFDELTETWESNGKSPCSEALSFFGQSDAGIARWNKNVNEKYPNVPSVTYDNSHCE
eukprot:CAMPEP_0168539138 /NCGR_PEP_ID=MMETSP0405-20121227/21641_1 /TAXON_ID=498012 /ORGANISM="Trichosphaerium sp, Strain Am-I-7 wt" /LENGTH=158 /DNA_ID=CAMNT_0008568627 /DNA_START=441 /DNA_END=917 /DNA_ORIENTATION=+